jgi:YbbR domain-containing protein
VLEGESTLNDDRDLTIISDRNELLENVLVRVRVSADDYSYVTLDSTTAYIDLKNINKPGKHTVKINARSTVPGVNIVSTRPEYVEIEVEELSSRTVPVQIKYEGELPEGYWMDTPIVEPKGITLRGPKSLVDQVRNAVCYLELSDLTQSFSNTLNVTLLNEKGEEVDSSTFVSDMPSAMVRATVLPKKTVPLNIESGLIGQDNLRYGYELVRVSGTPAQVEIAAEQELLDSITSLDIEKKFDLNGEADGFFSEDWSAKIIVPNGVTLLDYEQTEVEIVIAEKTDSVTFDDLDIDVKGVDRNTEAQLDTEKANVTFTGALSLIRALSRSDAQIYIDLTGLEAGKIYSVPTQIKLADKYQALDYELEPVSVTVTLTQK